MNPYRQLGKQTWTKGAQGTYDYPDLTRIRAVHQGKTKGCGLAVVLYLQQFDGQDTPDVSDPKDFEALYTRMGLDPEGYNSFAQLLEDVETPRLRYMWFRRSALGRKTRSMPEFNADVGPPERILAFLRNLLDTGHVFAVPFNGHFCVFVGYNQDGFLALGSYGNKGFHEIKETLLFADAVPDCLYVKVAETGTVVYKGARGPLCT